MNIPATPEKTIYSFREWAAKFLRLDLSEAAASLLWSDFTRDFMGGRN
jgi:hypothetical protein